MLRQVIQVDSISESIDKFGVLFYSNMVIQEQAGGYFFIDVNIDCPQVKMVISGEEKEEVPKPDCGPCVLCIKPLPMRIGWFIVQAVNLQNQLMEMHI